MIARRSRPTRPATVLVAVVAGLLLAALSVVWAPAAAAHNTLSGSDPAAGAVISAVPRTFSLTFNEQVKDEFVTVVLTPDGGAPITLSPTVSGPTVSATLPDSAAAAEAGSARAYRLGYRVISADGHPISGSIDFTVGAVSLAFGGGVAVTSAAVADVASASDASGTDGGTPVGWWVVAGALVLAVLVAGRLVFRSRRRPPRPEQLTAGSSPG